MDWEERFRSFVVKPPNGWRARLDTIPIGSLFLPPFVHQNGCAIGISIDETPSGRYLHLSISRPDRIPRWPEIVSARDAFLGRETACVHVVPDSRDHRNVHPFCLHIWAREDGTPIVDPMLAEYVAPRLG